jgi:hypothetical protein
MLGALRPGEADTLVRLLGRVAEALDPGCPAVGGSTSSSPRKDEP